MIKMMASIFLHPTALSFLNGVILILAYTAIKHTWFALDPRNHFHQAVELWEGFGKILLGFGVILEERAILRSILGITLPAQPSPEHEIEHACHDYGVFFVIFGVVIEAFAWLIKIPNAVLDAFGFEFTFLNLAAIFCIFGLFLQFRFFWRIHFFNGKFKA